MSFCRDERKHRTLEVPSLQRQVNTCVWTVLTSNNVLFDRSCRRKRERLYVQVDVDLQCEDISPRDIPLAYGYHAISNRTSLA
jgi:hypothetical protein